MSALVWCEFACDQCAGVSPGMWAAGKRVPREELTEMAENAGWVFFNGLSFCCKKCSAKACEDQLSQPTKDPHG